jgi:hypothetical protein
MRNAHLQRKGYLIRSFLAALILGFIILLISGCSTGSGYPLPRNTTPTSPEFPAARSEWTVLVYLCSENNLEHFGYLDVKQMEKVGSNDKLKIVVQWDRPELGTKLDWGGCRRYLVKKDHTSSQEINSQLLENLGNVNMGDPETLLDFINWGVEKFPADKYMLVLWNHGNGWRDLRLSEISARGIAFDDGSGDHLTMEDLRYALGNTTLADSSKIELISMDACLMGTIEVAYDMKDFANYLVFSSANVPGTGLPYDKILQALADNPEMSGREFAEIIVNEYSKTYPYHTSITQSAVDLSKITDLVEAFNSMLGNILVRSTDVQNNLVDCASRAMALDYTTEYSDYRDFGDFLDIAALDIEDAGVQENVMIVRTLLNETVVAEYHGTRYPYASGMSIWAPNKSQFDRLVETYRTTLFAQDTEWDELLESVLNVQ